MKNLMLSSDKLGSCKVKIKSSLSLKLRPQKLSTQLETKWISLFDSKLRLCQLRNSSDILYYILSNFTSANKLLKQTIVLKTDALKFLKTVYSECVQIDGHFLRIFTFSTKQKLTNKNQYFLETIILNLFLTRSLPQSRRSKYRCLQFQMVFFSKYLPIISFIVGTSALTFQIAVLYPWHNELDTEFKRLKELKEKQDRRLQEYNSKKMDKIHDLEAQVSYLISLQEQKIRRAKKKIDEIV